MREKLIELLVDEIPIMGGTTFDSLADYLIENGVVISDDVVSKELCEQIKWERDTA